MTVARFRRRYSPTVRRLGHCVRVSEPAPALVLRFWWLSSEPTAQLVQANTVITFNTARRRSHSSTRTPCISTLATQTHAQSDNVETLLVIEHTGVAYYRHSQIAALDVSDDYFGFLSVGPGSDVLSLTEPVDLADGSTVDGSDILTAADGLAVHQDTTLPHNDGLMPYSVQLQAGHTAADLRGFVVVQISNPTNSLDIGHLCRQSVGHWRGSGKRLQLLD